MIELTVCVRKSAFLPRGHTLVELKPVSEFDHSGPLFTWPLQFFVPGDAVLNYPLGARFKISLERLP
jgi:hypothetical protein